MSKVTLNKINLHYPLYDVNATDFRSRIMSVATGGTIKKGEIFTVHALKDISFEASAGDKIAILGGNGAGKSTLLKAMSNIYEPTSGNIDIQGNVATLLDLQLGMNDELTGLQNIYCMSYVMGCTKKEIEEKIDSIVEYSELGDFINIPVRTYSSGMRVRLAFSIIGFVQTDILLIDEFFGAGDKNFVQKAREKMFNIVKDSNILFLVSHKLDLVKEICNKAIIMNKGQIVEMGSMDKVGKKYFESI
jgi:ABC-2 type transport system ATP-binding protein/lipopolysaccharide transport system ATP-binding protein